MQVQTPDTKPCAGSIEPYAVGDHVSLYMVRGAERPARLASTVAVAKMTRTEARQLMGELAAILNT